MIAGFQKPRRLTITWDDSPFPREGDVLQSVCRDGRDGTCYLILSLRPVIRRNGGPPRFVASCRRVDLRQVEPPPASVWPFRWHPRRRVR